MIAVINSLNVVGGLSSFPSSLVGLNHEEEFRIDDGEFLHPRRMITLLFPKSKDPDVDIVVVSGDITTRKRKRSGSQSSEIYAFQTCFRAIANIYTIAGSRR